MTVHIGSYIEGASHGESWSGVVTGFLGLSYLPDYEAGVDNAVFFVDEITGLRAVCALSDVVYVADPRNEVAK